ncbi:hypothetical protein JW916_01505 [Candidatus Sumerlaeota bacterium]|nr:hypothetical protein [Candidatus Sumerlaeota bacterium]
MAFAAIAMAGLYFAGLQASSAQTESAQIDSLLRSRMEYLLSEKIDSPNLADGNEEVTIDGKTYTVSWTVVGVDLDDDGQVETDAKRIEVSVAGRSATTLVVDTGETLGKI